MDIQNGSGYCAARLTEGKTVLSVASTGAHRCCPIGFARGAAGCVPMVILALSTGL